MLSNFSQWQKPVSVFLTVLLLATSAWLLGKSVWMFQSEPVLPQWSPSNTEAPAKEELLDISALQNGALFGRYSQSVIAPEVPNVVDAPKTRLNLILVGVVASSNVNKNLAVISNRGTQVTYGLNEVIEGTRARLKAVLSDRVIIDNSGRDETLMLEGIDYSERSSVIEGHTVTQGISEQERLDSIRQAIVKNPQEIFQYVRLSQVKQDNTIVGYRVSPGKDAVLFNASGLQNGDIAIEFNGLDLTTPDVMNKLALSLPEMTEVNLTVLRDGQQYDIYIQF